jgi:hypothetical protein
MSGVTGAVHLSPPGYDADRDLWRGEMASSLVFNERVRLAAMAFNNLGIISMSTGVIAPVYESYISHDPFEIETSSFLVLALGLGFVAIAQFLLGRLRG